VSVIEPGCVLRAEERLTLIIAAMAHSSWPPPASWNADMLCATPWRGKLMRHDLVWDDAWIAIVP
jgi:hypothetical protein